MKKIFTIILMLSILPLSSCKGEELKEHTLTFVANNNTTITKIETHKYKDEFNLAKNTFTYSRHEFIGWSNDPIGAVEYYDEYPYVMPDKDVTLYAKWEHTGYFILFDNNGGEGTMEPALHWGGEMFILPKCTFTKEGYIFAGWATHEMGQVEVKDRGTYYMPNNDVILYAKWNFNGHKLTLDYQLDGVKDEVINLHHKDEYELPENKYVKEGYHFAGWALSPSDEIIVGDKETIIMPNNDLTLYAIWDENICNLSFHPNSGTGNMTNIIDQQGNIITLPPCSYNKEHYIFKGWSTSPTGEVIYADGDTITLPDVEELILYAIWEYSVFITVNLNDGTIDNQKIKTYQVPLNQSIDLLKDVGSPIPDNTNELFVGYKNASNNKFVLSTRSMSDETYEAIYYDYHEEASKTFIFDISEARKEYGETYTSFVVDIGVAIENSYNYIEVSWGDLSSDQYGNKEIINEATHHLSHIYNGENGTFEIKIYGLYSQISDLYITPVEN